MYVYTWAWMNYTCATNAKKSRKKINKSIHYENSCARGMWITVSTNEHRHTTSKHIFRLFPNRNPASTKTSRTNLVRTQQHLLPGNATSYKSHSTRPNKHVRKAKRRPRAIKAAAFANAPETFDGKATVGKLTAATKRARRPSNAGSSEM